MRLFKKHLKWFLDRIVRDRVDSTAAHVAFFLIISALPFIALVLTLMQRINFSDGEPMLTAAVNLLPQPVAEFIMNMFPSALRSGGVLSIAIVTAVWSSSIGMVALIKGLDQIYDAKAARNYIVLRIVAAIYVLAFALVIMLTAALLVFGSTIYRYLLSHSPNFLAVLLMNFKSILGFILLFVFFTLMFTFLPRRRVRFRYNVAGAAFGAGGWVLFSYLFSLVVGNVLTFSIYGGLATLVILMYWLFFCLYILFLGAEFAMWLEHGEIQKDLRERRERKKKAAGTSTNTTKESDK